MNKKKSSLFFLPILVALSIIILTYLFFVLLSKTSIDMPIGERQFTLLNTYMKAESSLFYIDQSAKYSLQQSVYDIGQKGGFSEIEVEEPPAPDYTYKAPSYGKCGRFYGYSIWQLENKDDCFDESRLSLALKYLFNKNLNQHLEKYPSSILANNYEYNIRDGIEVVGKAINSLVFYIGKDESKPIIKEPEKTTVQKTGNFVDFSGTEICAKGKKCVLTQEALSKLERAQQRAKDEKVSLEVTDAYRSLQSQIDEFQGRTPMQWNKVVPDENLRRAYVCYPYGNDVEQRCSHLSGNAVDIRLKGKTKDTMTRDDWQLLRRIMTNDNPDDRWVKYSGELWHFECCGTKRSEVGKAKGLVEVGEV